jgi:hypothetical protein
MWSQQPVMMLRPVAFAISMDLRGGLDTDTGCHASREHILLSPPLSRYFDGFAWRTGH